MATIEELTELNFMCQCAWECTKQSRWKEFTQRYLANMLLNTVHLRDELLSGTYRVRPTRDFYLNERGHLRFIEAPETRDRAVQKPLMKQILLPRLRPHLIYDNYASLEGRGTSFARKRFEIKLHRYIQQYGTDGYILLMDYSKFFENVVHEVLKQQLAPHLQQDEQAVRDLIHYMIDTASHTDRGLNLGSECPQIFAVFYPTPIDIFIKVVKAVKFYGRYMDDSFIIARTKQELEQLRYEISEQLKPLGLDMNNKKTHIVRLRHGFTFLQIKYNITPTGHIVKRMSHNKVARERRRLKAFKRLFDLGVLSENDVWQCYQSWRGSQVKDHNACQRTIARMDALYASLFPPHQPTIKLMRSNVARSINHYAESKDIYYCLTA